VLDNQVPSRTHTQTQRRRKKTRGKERDENDCPVTRDDRAIDIPDIKTARVYFWFFSFSSSPAQQQTAAVITNKSDLNVLQQWGVFVA
jgi:hypothetical protein